MDLTEESSKTPYGVLVGEEIRLLELCPAHVNDPLILTLEVVTLAEDSEVLSFEALSYAWGDPTKLCANPASVNHTPLSLTANLDIALRHLRSESTPRRLWVDAICIDQSNVQERGHQVSLMRRIYSSAFRVLVWLGPEADESNITFNVMSNHQLSRSEVPELIWSIYHLARRSWFTRIWVVQEVALAQDIKVICGSREVSWDDFTDFTSLVCSRIEGDRSSLLPELTPESARDPMLWRAMASRGDYQACIWDWEMNPELGHISMFLDILNDFNSIRRSPSAPFALQFNRTMYFVATDPRDKVYGILGLDNATIAPKNYNLPESYRPVIQNDKKNSIALHWCTPLVADYNKTTEEVFSLAMGNMIMNGFRFTYKYLPLDQIHNTDRPLLKPSWVADLTNPVRERSHPSHPYYLCPSMGEIARCLSISRGSRPFARFSFDARTLFAGGLPLGIISLSEKWPGKLGQRLLNYFRLDDERIVDGFFGVEDNIARYSGKKFHSIGSSKRWCLAPGRQDAYDVYLPKALETGEATGRYSRLLDAILPPEHPESADARLLIYQRERMVQDISSTPRHVILESNALMRLQRISSKIESHIESICTGRRFFVTNRGHMGLCPGRIKEGDELVGLFGLNFPFVLRKRQKQKGHIETLAIGRYTMVSVAHVGGHKLGHNMTADLHNWTDENVRKHLVDRLGFRMYIID